MFGWLFLSSLSFVGVMETSRPGNGLLVRRQVQCKVQDMNPVCSVQTFLKPFYSVQAKEMVLQWDNVCVCVCEKESTWTFYGLKRLLTV